jgi:uncharacterized repeat protein (TIGR02543 family)
LYNVDFTEPTHPYRVGYVFGGWFTDINLTDESIWVFDPPTPLTEDITLYAKWTPAVYTVTFNGNDTANAPATESL